MSSENKDLQNDPQNPEVEKLETIDELYAEEIGEQHDFSNAGSTASSVSTAGTIGSTWGTASTVGTLG